MISNKRFISWSAVSSKPQAEKISLEEQQITNRQHIERHNGILVAELIIPGESRDIVFFEDAARRIDAYRLLKDAVDSRAFDVLVFLNLGRLGRDIALIMAVVRLCQRANITLYATDAPPPNLDPSDNYIDTLMTALQAAGYQQEIAELRRRNRFGMIERIRQGDFPASIPWPWLQRFAEDGTEYLEIDPSGAAALSLIAEAYVQDGEGAALIARRLNEAGYASPSGGQWIGASVSYIVKNAKRYAGITEYNRRSVTGREYTIAPSRWPAVWSEETARAILKEKDRRWAARGAVRSPHRFSQCVYCSICKRKMRAAERMIVYKKGLVGEARYRYEDYRCNGVHSYSTNIVAYKITDTLRFEIEQLSLLDDLADALPATSDDTAAIAEKLADAKARLQALQDELDRADTAFTRGLMSIDRYQAQVERVNKSAATVRTIIANLEATIANIEPESVRVLRLEELAQKGLDMLAHPNVRLANAFFRHHVEIWVSYGKVDRIVWL